MTSLFLSGDPKADALLAEDRFALLVGMLLDQQVTMESAFAGPAKLAERLGKLDVDEIAEMNPDDFLDIFARLPRYTGSRSRWRDACRSSRRP